MYKIISHDVTQLNPYYDPARSRNGGGYDQPLIKWSVLHTPSGRVYDVTEKDTSCGDFGTRFYHQIMCDGVEIYSAYFGSMVNNDDDGDLGYTVHPSRIDEAKAVAALCFGRESLI